MKKILFIFSFFLASQLQGQTFSFQCVCEHLTAPNCDICNTNVLSRSFHGLLIKRNGVNYKYIDEPYTVRQLNGKSIEFLELIPNPDKVTISLFQTPYSTIEGFLDSTTCFCGLGGAMNDIEVDTPLIGNGSTANPLTIGQFGADTTMYLNWNGHHWYPDKIDFTDIHVNLPYFTSDTAALAGGLVPGDPYLLECNNDYDLPAGIFKVVKICGYDCTIRLYYYANDPLAMADGVLIGKEYVLDEFNTLGILYGFVKVVTNDTLNSGTLICDTILPSYINNAAAITGGLTYGNHYLMSASNTLGAPEGMNIVVSLTSSTSADAQVCCDTNENLPFYPNNAAAISGGLTTGNYYYLNSSNTLGYPYGTKKRI